MEPCAKCSACPRRPRIKVCVTIDLGRPIHWKYDTRDMATYLKSLRTTVYCIDCAKERNIGVQLPAQDEIDAFRAYWDDRKRIPT